MTKIIRPKLEKNYKPSEWSPLSVWTSSLIKQTADSVKIQVEQEIQGLSGLTQRVGTLEVTASAITQDVQALSATTTGMTQQIGNLTVKSDSISASVTTLQEKVAGVNLFPLNGWIDSNNKFVEVYGNDIEYSGSTNSTAITSPNVWLEVGDYTLSVYEQSNHALHEKTGTISNTNYTVMSGLENQFKNIYRDYANIHISTAGNYQFYINSNHFYKPKLEVGLEPTPYSNQNIDHHSLIQQTDSSISLKVVTEVETQGLVNETQLKETGIDITNGQITLNADKTQIVGNLELKDSEQGLKVINNNMERISIANESISGMDNYEFSTYFEDTLSGANVPLNSSLVWDVNIGHYNATEKLELQSVFIVFNLDNDSPNNPTKNAGLTYSISLKQGNNSITGTTGSISESAAYYDLPSWTVNSIPSDGDYTLHITVTPSFTSTQGASYIDFGKCHVVIKRNNEGCIRIGNNGAMFATDQYNYNYMGEDLTHFRKGWQRLEISENGITRNNVQYLADGSINYGLSNYGMGDVSSTVPVRIVTGSTYTPTPTDCVIVFSPSNSSTQCKIVLPNALADAFPVGKMLIVRNIRGGNTVMDGDTNGQRIYYRDGNGVEYTSDLTDKTWQYVYCGIINGDSVWLEFGNG